jgi:hypothetical protein
MALLLLLGIVELAVFVQVVYAVGDYRKHCDGSPRRMWGPRPYYHAPPPRHWRAR